MLTALPYLDGVSRELADQQGADTVRRKPLTKKKLLRPKGIKNTMEEGQHAHRRQKRQRQLSAAEDLNRMVLYTAQKVENTVGNKNTSQE